MHVGAALPGERRPHHKPVFDFDEDALLVTASIFVQIVRDLLSTSGGAAAVVADCVIGDAAPIAEEREKKQH